ncbi:acyl-phosphate glycerol-3-phosphate acyltransferase [Faunimonas pinastri]|uniref:Glycerol-3-phosphate acyltransferase n=1 Tax=Faunimonas pinastri TaxID=1855383 RepID=A0A1H9CGK6_9HYPH|nr:glycerol-3-phosphate 1-O-acyltransferase PlsY [Faunimonas pinastri]SEP99873.1 acyl-phosphate glycerol-3-phosphate acyltransferase [Faunimonas pinastri]
MTEFSGWADAWPYYLGALVIGYLLGSIPFGLIFTRMAGLGDIRAIGSGNIGATNVLRTGNKKLAAATLLCDALKGMAAVLIVSLWVGRHAPALVGPADAATGLVAIGPAALAALGAFLGHCFPIWLGFRGGKGVATFLGLLLALHWPTFLAVAVVWIVVAFLTRYSSLSALMGSAAAPIILFLFGRVELSEVFLVLTLILWWRHRTNIRRLVSGEESRIGRK